MIEISIIYQGLEFFFWSLSVLLWSATCVTIIYQLAVLYLPYWKWQIFGYTDRFPFPDYFYQVYGVNATSLSFEHYGYLLGAVGVCIISGPHLWNSRLGKLKSE